jgi:hypothetical protein
MMRGCDGGDHELGKGGRTEREMELNLFGRLRRDNT